MLYQLSAGNFVAGPVISSACWMDEKIELSYALNILEYNDFRRLADARVCLGWSHCPRPRKGRERPV